MQKTEQSEICRQCWVDLPNHYHNCILDAFVIMPNHVHMIILLKNHGNIIADNDAVPVSVKDVGDINDDVTGVVDNDVVETGFKPVSTVSTKSTATTSILPTGTATKTIKPYSVSEIIRGFKTFTARKINDFQNTQGKPFWQSRFYDHIIRNRESLESRRRYIINNPAKYDRDRNNIF